MNVKLTIFFSCVFLAVFFVSQASEDLVDSVQVEEKKPNIIFILADDLGYGDVGFNGQQKIRTPHIDNLAREGIIFTQHYAGTTVCGPSRGVLMTGYHTGHSTIRGNPNWTVSGNPVDLNRDDVTIAEELKRAGYHTAIIGKWGLAENLGEGMPHRQGFDYFYGFPTHVEAHHYYQDSVWINDRRIAIPGNDPFHKRGKYVHDLFTEKALDYISDKKENPFFLFLSYMIPHSELTVPEDSKEQYRKLNWPLREMTPGHYRHDKDGFVTYAGMVSRMDQDVGRVMKQLKELGIDDNTLVIFTSDHGHAFDNVDDPFFNSNGPFRGKKRDLYEGGLRVPFAARWPEKIRPGSVSHHVSAFWDLLPTFTDIAGLSPTKELDGISFLPTLVGDRDSQKEHDYLYWEFNERQGPVQAIRKGQWKAVKFLNQPIELYNLIADPAELHNSVEDFPEIAHDMENIIRNARTDHPEFPLERRSIRNQ